MINEIKFFLLTFTVLSFLQTQTFSMNSDDDSEDSNSSYNFLLDDGRNHPPQKNKDEKNNIHKQIVKDYMSRGGHEVPQYEELYTYSLNSHSQIKKLEMTSAICKIIAGFTGGGSAVNSFLEAINKDYLPYATPILSCVSFVCIAIDGICQKTLDPYRNAHKNLEEFINKQVTDMFEHRDNNQAIDKKLLKTYTKKAFLEFYKNKNLIRPKLLQIDEFSTLN